MCGSVAASEQSRYEQEKELRPTCGAPSGSLSSLACSSAGARYTRVKGTARLLDGCVEEGGILLVSGTPRPSPRVPPTPSCHSGWLSVCPTESPRACVVLAVLRGYFFCSWDGKSIDVPPGLRANLQQLGGRLSRARDFCWGSPRPDGKMHVGALEFQFPAWLVWPMFFLSLGEGH